jgi:hypothetical protein
MVRVAGTAAIVWSVCSGALLAQGVNVLLAVNVDSNPEGNQSIVDRLTNEFGFGVTVIDDDAPRNPVAEDAMGMSLVVISSTVLSGNVGTAFTDQDPVFRAMEIPTIQWEQALHDEFLFADNGTNATGDTITITEAGADHPLAAGLGPGDILVRNSSTEFHFASLNNLAQGYETIAEINGLPAIGIVEPGGVLNDGQTTASARRIDLFYGDPALADVTAEGLALFDAAIRYAIAFDPNVTPGDFNDDGAIDSLDFDILSANFNTRDKEFADGDMDFNRRVNLADFIAFREVFAEANAAGAAAVPEPPAATLLAAGILGLLCRRRGRNSQLRPGHGRGLAVRRAAHRDLRTADLGVN